MGWDDAFSERAQNGNLTVGIIGLGYVGLPLAAEFAKSREVIGFDIDAEVLQICSLSFHLENS